VDSKLYFTNLTAPYIITPMKIHTTIYMGVKYAGNKSKLAKLLGISRQAVNNWKNEVLPQSSALKLYLISNRTIGKIID